MAEKPVDLQIVEAVRERLASVTVANGFHTDAGKRVLLSRAIDDAHDVLPALVVWLGDSTTAGTPQQQPGLIQRVLTLHVVGVVEPSVDDPLAEIIKLASDIKRAVYRLDDLRLVPGATGDLVLGDDEYFPREEGMNEAQVQVNFTVPFFETFES